ncbi:MAG: hypothetical protein F4210_13630 [Holophagales bacterium]|nr:hypothetical protein [Holophagales bacterium]MYF96520.1 hypothetical protein [Holophagales bacterium]
MAAEILELNDRSVEERLAATKMVVSADDPTPTICGLLVLGKRPRDFLPGAYVQFLRVAGVELQDVPQFQVDTNWVHCTVSAKKESPS